jgi:DNA ligase (NAD+)
MEASKRMIELAALLNAYNYQYYVLNKPTVSDYEFDMMLKELETLEKQEGIVLPTSPTQRIGSDLENGFKEVHREKVMGSIANCYDKDELLKWMQSVAPAGTMFTVGPKYDGTSCSLIYKKGVLTQASTRGNGYVGSDITENARTIKSIPLSIPMSDYDCEIRGEILMPKSSFQKLNKERIEQGFEPFANERNAAAGSIKQQSSKITAGRGLIFRPFAVDCPEAYFTGQSEMTRFAEGMGFTVDIPDFNSTNPQEIIDYLGEFEQKYLKNMDYCMDGVVIKVNDLRLQNELGYSQKVPYWAKAFKFKQESASTKILDIDWQIGRTGKLTPVGILEPVQVDGSMISNVTLNNIDFITDMDIRRNSYVFIEKGGAVIPKVTGIDYERHILENKDFEQCVKFHEPEICPCCGAKLEKKINQDGQEGAHIYCTNEDCRDRVLAKLSYFVSKDCMDIDGLSIKTLEKMYDNLNLRNWYDLYKYILDDLYAIGIGKNAEKIYDNIQKSKSMPADRVLTALGIPMIGKVASKALLEDFGSIRDLYTDIVEYHGDKLYADKPIGNAAMEELCAFVLDEDSQIIFANLFDLLNYTYISNKPVGGPLEGKTLLATGTLENFPREEIKDSIINNGGKYASSVSKKLDYLIVGAKPGASKVTKATELGVKMISESEYLDMIKK